MLPQEHFLRRKAAILAAVDAYASGTAAVGAEERAGPSAAGTAHFSDAGAPQSPAAGGKQGAGAAGTAGSTDATVAESARSSAAIAAISQRESASEADREQDVAEVAVPAAGSGGVGAGSAGPGAGASSQGFRILLQQLKPRLEETIDSLLEVGQATAE